MEGFLFINYFADECRLSHDVFLHRIAHGKFQIKFRNLEVQIWIRIHHPLLERISLLQEKI